MTIRVFSDEDLERLRSFPEINREELIRFFTLTSADVEFIDPGRGLARPIHGAGELGTAGQEENRTEHGPVEEVVQTSDRAVLRCVIVPSH